MIVHKGIQLHVYRTNFWIVKMTVKVHGLSDSDLRVRLPISEAPLIVWKESLTMCCALFKMQILYLYVNLVNLLPVSFIASF